MTSGFLNVIKQNIVTSLKKNLVECNIEDIISNINSMLNIEIEASINEKGYKLFVCDLNIKKYKNQINKKISGFGRTKFEAYKCCLINLIELLLESEEYIDSIKELMKILVKKSQVNSTNESSNKRRKFTYPTEIILNDNDDYEDKILVSMLTNDKNLIISHENVFSIYGEYSNFFETDEFLRFKNEYQEKTLIINELEKMVYDMMDQIKKISETFSKEIETYPDYFKCPISWEKIENPVVSIEGHSYEKWAIEKWFVNQDTSPITGLSLSSYNLINNYALKSAIDDYNIKIQKNKKMINELGKYLTKSEYDLSDLKKYFNSKVF